MLMRCNTDFSATGGGYDSMASGFLKDLLNSSVVDFVPCQVGFLKGYGISLAGVNSMSSSFPR